MAMWTNDNKNKKEPKTNPLQPVNSFYTT